jgi:hypothetical protein
MAQHGLLWLRARAHVVFVAIVMAVLFIGVGPFFASQALGAQITNRSLKPSNNAPGAHNVVYETAFTIPTTGTVGSIEILFCSNSALIEDVCVPPYGLDALNANLTTQSGPGGFVLSPTSGVNNLLLTRVPANLNAGAASFTFDQIVNPTDAGSYYVKVFTYASADATGSPIDFGAMAFPIIDGYDVSAEVPPYLTFCTGVGITNFDCSTAQGDQIGLGELNSVTSNVAQSQLLAATNAGSGYNIYVYGTTMTSGNNIIPAVANATSQVGTSQFGINLRSNSNPDIGQDPSGGGTGVPTPNYNLVNRFRFGNSETIATAAGAQDYKKYTVSYLVNVNKDQAPGVYSTTLTYVCVANF